MKTIYYQLFDENLDLLVNGNENPANIADNTNLATAKKQAKEWMKKNRVANAILKINASYDDGRDEIVGSRNLEVDKSEFVEVKRTAEELLSLTDEEYNKLSEIDRLRWHMAYLKNILRNEKDPEYIHYVRVQIILNCNLIRQGHVDNYLFWSMVREQLGLKYFTPSHV